MKSMLSFCIFNGMRPAACTASQWRNAPCLCTISAMSLMGWITPVSLLTNMIETRLVFLLFVSCVSNALRSIRPFSSMGVRVRSGSASRTAECSLALTMICSSG